MNTVGGKNSSLKEVPRDVLASLQQENRLIMLLFHRNKNQHRVAKWWKQFCTLKRVIRKLLNILQKWHQSRQNELYYILNRFVKVYVKKMYYEFNGVIALGQFPTLGVVLIGHLSRIYHICKELIPLVDKRLVEKMSQKQDNILEPKNMTINMEQLETLATESNEELGEIITESEINDSKEPSTAIESTNVTTDNSIQDKPSTNKKGDKPKKKKKKSKKPKSAIDSIFG